VSNLVLRAIFTKVLEKVEVQLLFILLLVLLMVIVFFVLLLSVKFFFYGMLIVLMDYWRIYLDTVYSHRRHGVCFSICHF